VAEREASCSCGRLRVTVEGEPVRVAACHCLACQRRTGSVFGVQGWFLRDQARIEGSSREFVRESDEGEVRRFHFCPECGATVYHFAAALPELLGIPAGAFADPSFPPPQVSVWEARKHAWVTMPPGIESIP
jgi:hypothetical protein